MATTARSVCPLDCPDRCSLDVRLEGGRVVALEGNRLNPVTGGFICAKVRRFPERVYGRDRVAHPLRRSGPKGAGSFTRIGWDEALDLVAQRMESVRRAHGGEAILPFAYGGSNGLLTQGSLDEALFRGLGASRLARTVCAAQTGLAAAALYGKMACADLADAAESRFLLLWGGNPRASNVHLLPFVRRARERGAMVVLVDPRDTLGPGWVDIHLAVRPGADAAVALAMIGHLERTGGVDHAFLAAHTTGAERLLARAREWPLERAAARAGVAAADIARVTEAYAEASPALVRCGWGVERNRNGEAAVAAILALPAVAGKFGVRGGGYAMSTSEAFAVDGDRLAGVPEADTRVVNMSQLGRVLQDGQPPVRLLFVYDANPAVTLPDQERVRRGLAREDLFTVVFDPVLTDTARWADLVLPATTFLEHPEITTAYGTYVLGLAEPVIAPVGEARANPEVFRALAERLGLPVPPAGDGLLAHALASVRGRLAGEAGEPSGPERLRRLRQESVLRLEIEGERPLPFVNVFPRTPDARIHLWPEELGGEPYAGHPDPADPAHPLALISPSSDRAICSTLSELDPRELALDMHPDDAAARGLGEGQEVRVRSRVGEVRVPLRLSRALRPGVVCLPKGTWDRQARSGNGASALAPDDVSPLSGGALFNDARVEVLPA